MSRASGVILFIMDFKIEKDFLVIRIPKREAEKLNLFELKNFVVSREEQKGGYYAKPSEQKNAFLACLPVKFTTAEALSMGADLGLQERAVKRFMTDRTVFGKLAHGEYVKLRVENESFIDFEYYENILLTAFEKDDKGFMSTTELYEILLDTEGGCLSLTKIGKALKRMGLERKAKKTNTGNVIKGYNLKLRSNE